MAARALLDPRSLLLVALGCSGCDLDRDWVDRTPPDPNPWVCEIEAVGEDTPPSAEPSRLLSPAADVRITCAEHPDVERTSVAIGAEGVYVVADGTGSSNHYALYRLDHLDSREDASVTGLRWPMDHQPCWADLQVDDDAIVSLFSQSLHDPVLWRATTWSEDWRVESTGAV